jgi:pSer/pThr/pTyr-binding forkhead associated (FHA) protein
MDDQTGGEDTNKLDAERTVILSKSSPWVRKLKKSVAGTGALVTHREIDLVIRNMAERVLLHDDKPVMIGRADLESGYRPEVDLSPYGAQDHGVSREHARLHLHNQRLYITDLGSSNGTFLAGQRLNPHQAYVVREGDEVLLGRLSIRIEIGT